jgi:hypothetical protein
MTRAWIEQYFQLLNRFVPAPLLFVGQRQCVEAVRGSLGAAFFRPSRSMQGKQTTTETLHVETNLSTHRVAAADRRWRVIAAVLRLSIRGFLRFSRNGKSMCRTYHRGSTARCEWFLASLLNWFCKRMRGHAKSGEAVSPPSGNFQALLRRPSRRDRR